MQYKEIQNILKASHTIDDGKRLNDVLIPGYEFTISNAVNREIVVFKNLDGSFLTRYARDTFKESSLNRIIGFVRKLQIELERVSNKDTANNVEVRKQIDDDCPFGESVSYDVIENKQINRKSCDVYIRVRI